MIMMFSQAPIFSSDDDRSRIKPLLYYKTFFMCAHTILCTFPDNNVNTLFFCGYPLECNLAMKYLEWEARRRSVSYFKIVWQKKRKKVACSVTILEQKTTLLIGHLQKNSLALVSYAKFSQIDNTYCFCYCYWLW